MSPNLEQRLYQTFPKLYQHLSYFECCDGWFDLIWNLSEKLESIIKISPAPDPELFPPEYTSPEQVYFAQQVKEKFGSLRFYLAFSTEEMEEVIHEFEEESKSVCETCGHPGKMRRLSHIRVSCDDCFN